MGIELLMLSGPPSEVKRKPGMEWERYIVSPL
jgi:hypothetical protein